MPVYLDYNATAPVRPQVLDVMQQVQAVPANPSSVHSFGREAKKKLEDSRKIIAEAIGVFTNEIIFTATGSEANNMALRAVAGSRILVSAVEHSSVLKPSPLEGEGWVGGDPENSGSIIRGTTPLLNPPPQGGRKFIPVDHNGIIDLSVLEKTLRDGLPSLVSIMLANNETGVIQPISDIAKICKKHGALLHTDAVQALGKIPVDFGLLGCDMLTLSAHKMGGPVGAACLVVRQNLPISPMILGGGQELNRRAGTENIPAIVGFAKAVELIDFSQMELLRGWVQEMEDSLKPSPAGRGLGEGGTTSTSDSPHPSPLPVGEGVERLPNTSCLVMQGVSGEVQLMNFDLAGFAVSSGSACSSGRIETSHVLAAMGLGDAAKQAIRVSGGWNTKQQDIEDFTKVWQQTFARLNKKVV